MSKKYVLDWFINWSNEVNELENKEISEGEINEQVSWNMSEYIRRQSQKSEVRESASQKVGISERQNVRSDYNVKYTSGVSRERRFTDASILDIS